MIENRIYRNVNAAIFEEIAPGVFNQLASWSNAIFDIDIDYSDSSITNTYTGTLDPGSLAFFRRHGPKLRLIQLMSPEIPRRADLVHSV
jgi:hypothetical protein